MTSIVYRLPRTELVISGVLRTSTDALTLVGGKPEVTRSLVSSEVKLVTSADLEYERTLTPPKNPLGTYKGSFGVTADGRLSSAAFDATGELGAIIKSVASLAGTALALVALGGPAAAADDPVLAAYRAAYEPEADVLIKLRSQRKTVEAQLRTALTTAVEDGGDLAEPRRLRSLLALIDERLVPAEAHFNAWRAEKITTVDAAFELRVALTDIPASVKGEWGGGGAAVVEGVPGSLEQLWKGYGVGVECTWLTTRNSTAPTVNAKSDHVYARVPDLLELRVMKSSGTEAIESSRARAVVADKHSKITDYKLETSHLGHKSLALTFDADGFVSVVGVEGSSAIAAGLAAATGGVEGFTAGVEGGTK